MVYRIKGPSTMKLSYDERTDTLYMFIGDQNNTVARDIGNGILLKYKTGANKAVGAVIHDFEARFKKENSSFVEIPVFA